MGTKRNRYCTHLRGKGPVTKSSWAKDRCFKTNDEAIGFCSAASLRGRCCEVYSRKVGRKRGR